MDWSPEQDRAFDEIMRWYRSGEKRYVLAGYAGAGKTTLAKRIADEVRRVVFCAYTGKSASVLRDKGCRDASTIHGMLYLPEEGPKDEVKFFYQPKPEWLGAQLIIVDEFSMLDERLVAAIERDGRRILYLGVPFQLTPIKGKCPLVPNFFIEQIHRQAAESSIIGFSKDIREGREIPFGDHGDLKYLRQVETAPELYTTADQLIVGRNDTRKAWNAKFRRINSFISPLPVIGDKLICRRNNHDLGLYNGMIGYALNTTVAKKSTYQLDFESFKDLSVWIGGVLGHDGEPYRGMEHFEYSYCITAHLSQGSEFDNILVYNESVGSTELNRRKWKYTSLTRAKKQCILVEPKTKR